MTPAAAGGGYTLPDHPIDYGKMVPIVDLHVDPAVQRSLDDARAKRMADDFKATAVGTIVVSERADGKKYIVDGMHRHKACVLEGSLTEMACEVHHGLSLADEAQLFLIKNRESKGVGAFDLYKVGVSAGITEFVQTNQVLAKHGLEISSGGSSTNRVGAAGGFPRIVLTLGAEYLDRALSVLEAAFGKTAYTWEGNLVYGTARVIKQYGDKISDIELVKKLKSVGANAESTVQEINGRARSEVGSSGSGSRRMAGFYVILDRANYRRAKNKKNLIGPPAYVDAKLGYPAEETLALATGGDED